jgi:hypothetical protein
MVRRVVGNSRRFWPCIRLFTPRSASVGCVDVATQLALVAGADDTSQADAERLTWTPPRVSSGIAAYVLWPLRRREDRADFSSGAGCSVDVVAVVVAVDVVVVEGVLGAVVDGGCVCIIGVGIQAAKVVVPCRTNSGVAGLVHHRQRESRESHGLRQRRAIHGRGCRSWSDAGTGAVGRKPEER